MEGVAVVGLGAMGLAMARTLADAGFAVTGYDISAEQREAFAPSVASLGDLASTHTVVLSLPDDAAVVAVVDELMDRLERGAVIVDTSTIGAETARRMQADAASQGVGYVDAPVSGGPAGAASGTLLMMIGGADRDVDIATSAARTATSTSPCQS
ncbi:NAD(P)-binding domain-containing protein [Acuticoccus sp.]|uniref:NAD(P)-binding domain-containing protein n=1 Tax=Acuticoccus sp. TaxID=1904378 RepID=UPI003B521F2A